MQAVKLTPLEQKTYDSIIQHALNPFWYGDKSALTMNKATVAWVVNMGYLVSGCHKDYLVTNISVDTHRTVKAIQSVSPQIKELASCHGARQFYKATYGKNPEYWSALVPESAWEVFRKKHAC